MVQIVVLVYVLRMFEISREGRSGSEMRRRDLMQRSPCLWEIHFFLILKKKHGGFRHGDMADSHDEDMWNQVKLKLVSNQMLATCAMACWHRPN